MPERVVDGLEVVEVDDHHRDGLVAAVDLVQGRLCALEEVGAVRERRQHIEMRAALKLCFQLVPLFQQILGSLQALERQHALRGEALQRRLNLVGQRLGALQDELADAIFLECQRGGGLVPAPGDRLTVSGELERASSGAEQEARPDVSMLTGDGGSGLDDRRTNPLVLAGRGETAHRAAQHQLAPGGALLAKDESGQPCDHQSDDGDRADDGGEDVELLGAAGVLDEEDDRSGYGGRGQQGQSTRGQLVLTLGSDVSELAPAWV